MNLNQVGLIQMSLMGAVLIIAIIIIRAATINRLPKKTFLILWGIAGLRLCIPFHVSLDFGTKLIPVRTMERWKENGA